MSGCDFARLITMYETGGLDNAMKTHLHNCPDCRKRLRDFLALTGAMVLADVDHEREDCTTLPEVSLPDRLKNMVDARKTKWQRQQLGQVLQFKDSRNRQDPKKIMNRLMGEEIFDLPKAAFPDDLDDEE